MVLTDNEKRELALEVLRILREQSIGVNELPKAETMDGVNALPAYQTKDGEEKAVVVPIDLLGKPAIEAAAVANEVIDLARQTIADTEAAINAADKATNSVNQSKQEAEEAAAAALAAANSVDESKAAAEEATDMAKKAAESAIRASDDADNVSSAVSEEWSGFKNEITQSTERAENGATLANEAIQKVNDFLAESGGKLLTDEEREKLLNTYSKSETYSRPEIDAKNQETLDASREYATRRIAEMIGGAPEALDTLFEIAAALGNDPHFATSIMALLNGKADTEHRHSVSQITDFPASLPASDVHPWAKQPTKPSYTAAEVGASPANHKHLATDITEDSTHRFMTDSERSKLAGLEASSIKKISDFYQAKTTGVYAVTGNAAGGPKYNDSEFISVGCLKVIENYVPTPPGNLVVPDFNYFLLMEFTVKRNDDIVFHFIKFRGVVASIEERWFQVLPFQLPPTVEATPTPTT